MKTLAIIGSKNLKGLTAKCVDALTEGIGGELEKILLADLKMERCRMCDDKGWGTCVKKGECAINDDFNSLREKVSKSDLIIFATPVYFGDLSESMKAFIDRLRRCCVEDHLHPEYVGKKVVGICMAGGTGGGVIHCCFNLEKALLRCGFDVVDIIPVKRQNADLKIETLKQTGKWLAKN